MAAEDALVGAVRGILGFRYDPAGSHEFDAARRKHQEQSNKPIVQHLGFTVDEQQLVAYRRKLDEVRARNARREGLKAKLGADYDPRAFNAFERDAARAKRSNEEMVTSSAKVHTAFGNIYGRGGSL